VEVTESGKLANLLQYKVNYSRKMFYTTIPRFPYFHANIVICENDGWSREIATRRRPHKMSKSIAANAILSNTTQPKTIFAAPCVPRAYLKDI